MKSYLKGKQKSFDIHLPGDLMQTPSMKDGPQYSGAVERCGTPGGSILVSPAGTPRHHNNSTNQTPKSHKPTSVLDSSKSPVNGRMTKVSFFNLFKLA